MYQMRAMAYTIFLSDGILQTLEHIRAMLFLVYLSRNRNRVLDWFEILQFWLFLKVYKKLTDNQVVCVQNQQRSMFGFPEGLLVCFVILKTVEMFFYLCWHYVWNYIQCNNSFSHTETSIVILQKSQAKS